MASLPAVVRFAPLKEILRQVTEFDLFPFADYDGLFHQVKKFPDVAGEIVVQEILQDVR